MTAKQFLILGASMLASFLGASARAEETKRPYVRVAQIDVYPAQLDNYKAAIKEEIEDSIRLEPGVLTLYAVSEKDNPTRIIVFEIYADMEAYKAHIETPHFRKYKTDTESMVKTLTLIDTDPVALGAKSK